jgi:hypothetical protein
MQVLSNAATRAVGDLDRAIGVTSAWSRLLQGGANDLNVFSQTMQLSAAQGEGAFMQLANGVGALVGRAGFGAIEVSANAVNSTLNLLTGGILGLNENVRLMPANLQPAEVAIKTMGAQLQQAQKEYDALSERLKTAPDNIYIKSELGNLARYITALKEAQAQKSALTGAAFAGPVEYGNESKREASRQGSLKLQQDRAAALAEFQKTFASPDQKAAAAVKEWRDRLGGGFSPEMEAIVRGRFAPAGRTGGGAGAGKGPDAATNYLENLQKQLQATKDLSVEETLLADAQAGRLGKINPERLKEIQAVARQIDDARIFAQIEKEFAAAQADTARSTARAREEQDKLIKSWVDATPAAQAEQLRKNVELLNKAYEDGRISAEQMMNVLDSWDKVNQKSKEANENAKIFGQITTSAFEDAIIEGKKFSDVLKGMAQDLLKLVLRRNVTEPLAQAAGSFLGNLFSFDGGGWTGDGPRSGGVDGKGGFMAVLHPREQVIDTTKGGGAGGNVVINQYNTFSGSGNDQAQMAAWARQVKQETLAAVQLSANRGGSFASSVGRA